MVISLTEQIGSEARRLGFFKMGIIPVGPLPKREALDAWLEKGMQGAMHYVERQADKRKNPNLILEDARSILVLAMNYYPGEESACSGLQGRISRYAWGEDYHRMMKERLIQLSEFIRREKSRAEALCYVDTGPVMEKVWGAQSSLGWMGKHSNLITRERGSWFFLGVILSNLELEYDTGDTNYCGQCIRCMVACPTGAIVAPYVVDARLCISYLTIELRGVIPRALRPLMGNRIYGCDDCQEICPWNRFAVKTAEKGFCPPSGTPMPELISLASLSDEEFDRRFERSAIRRARRDGLVRNVMVALGNSQDHAALPALGNALKDSCSVVRGHAAWALGQISTPEAYAALHAAQAHEKDPVVLEEIQVALGG